ncbi:anti-sigma factor [Deminuibacter soli]|nr:hypothetical protein [Deminuibacter soli]
MLHCTTEDLLLYLYGELPEEEAERISLLLQQSWSLREKLQVLKEAHGRLEKAPLHMPRQQSIALILQKAKAVRQTVKTSSSL